MSSFFSAELPPLINELERARNSVVLAGKAVVAVTAADGVVILGDQRKPDSKLQGVEAFQKVRAVSEKGPVFAFTGFLPDGKKLFDKVRTADYLEVKRFAETIASYQYDRLTSTSTRLVLATSLICGFDSPPSSSTAGSSPPRIFSVALDSTLHSYKALALGGDAATRQKRLDERWREGMSTDEAVELALACVSVDERATVECTVLERGKSVKVLTRDDLLSHLPPVTATDGRTALPLDSRTPAASDSLEVASPAAAFQSLVSVAAGPRRALEGGQPTLDMLVVSGIVCVGSMALMWSIMR
ncbi:hypothetical protein JCM10207_003857 [Rhodosporidiobolus poonsookiae]